MGVCLTSWTCRGAYPKIDNIYQYLLKPDVLNCKVKCVGCMELTIAGTIYKVSLDWICYILLLQNVSVNIEEVTVWPVNFVEPFIWTTDRQFQYFISGWPPFQKPVATNAGHDLLEVIPIDDFITSACGRADGHVKMLSFWLFWRILGRCRDMSWPWRIVNKVRFGGSSEHPQCDLARTWKHGCCQQTRASSFSKCARGLCLVSSLVCTGQTVHSHCDALP